MYNKQVIINTKNMILTNTKSFVATLTLGCALALSAMIAPSLTYADGTGTYTPTGYNPASAQANLEADIIAQARERLLIAIIEELASRINHNSDPSQDVNSEAADLRVSLNKALQGHVDLSLNALFNVVDESDDLDASIDALDENTQETASVIGSIFGTNAEDDFTELWQDHIGFFVDYAVGAREGDTSDKGDAEDDLAASQEQIADFISDTITSLSASTIEAEVEEHTELILAAIDAYEDGDYNEAYEYQLDAEVQVQGLADALSTGIVSEHPELF